MQRGIAISAFSVDIHVVRQKKLDHVHVAAARSVVQRRSPPVVFAGDQTWIPREELLYLREVTLLRRIVDVATERGDTAN